MTGTKARDVECPTCCAWVGMPCIDNHNDFNRRSVAHGYHPERIKAAAAVTRAANREARR